MEFPVFVFILVIFTILLIKWCLTIVPQGYEYTVENLGRFTKILKPSPMLPPFAIKNLQTLFLIHIYF